MPTAVIGDINEDFLKGEKLKKNSTKFVSMMTDRGFHQQIKEPTRVSGSGIDHLYINNLMQELTISTQIDGAYYSDHDILTLYVPKQK